MATRGGSAPRTYEGALRLLQEAFESGELTIKEYAAELQGMQAGMTAAAQGVKSFNTIIASWQQAFSAAADLMYKNIDEQVALYQAQVKVIQNQNLYTQALALQATAVQVYGRGSEQAQRTQVALNYVGALYTQSQKDRLVAENNLATATAKNVATITQSIMNMITSFQQFSQTLVLVGLAAQEAGEEASLAWLGPLGMVAGLGLTLGMGAYQLSQMPRVMPTYQKGGIVERTGPIFAHAGETIVPRGGSSMPNVEINITATSNVDLAKVRQEVQKAIARAWYEGSKSRGTY
jgi:hypothetical protein